MDKLDENILVELLKNSRMPLSQLAKKCRVSREVITYRINNLKQKEIIKDFFTQINAEKLGFISTLFFVRINAKAEKEFIEYVKKLDFVSWAGTHLGVWSLGMAIYGKNNKEIEEKFQKIYSKFKEQITDHKIEFYKTKKFFYEKYFNKNVNIQTKKENLKIYKIDSTDKKILFDISRNSRISSVELAGKLKMTATAVIKRIKNLEKYNYIQKYSIFVNASKLNKNQFVFFIKNKNLDQINKLYSYLESHQRVLFLIDYLGDPFIEFCIFAENSKEAKKISQEIEESFPENRIIDFFLGQDEFISNIVPKCVFY